MEKETPSKVTEGTSADVDFDEVAANLGIPAKKPADQAKAKAKDAEADEDTEDSESEESKGPEDEKSDDEGETPESEDGEEDDDAEDKEEAQEPTKVQKRIDRLTAEKHELREQLDATRQELDQAKAQAEAKPPVIYKDPENPLSSFTDAASLEAEIAKAQAVLDWTDDNRDGGSVTVGGEEKFYDSDAVKQIRANARNILKAGPKQQEYLRQRAPAVEEAKTFYPDFFKQGTTAHNFLQATLKQYPQLVSFPNWELIVGDAFEGQRLRLARIEQAQKRASTDKPKKSPAQDEKVHKVPTPSAAPKVSNSSGANLRHKAAAALKAKGDRGAIEAFVEELV